MISPFSRRIYSLMGLVSLWLCLSLPAVAGPVNDWLEAARKGDRARLEALVNQVGINALDSNGNTALIFAVREGHVELARWLIAKGAKLNLQRTGQDDWQGWTALMFAAQRGDVALASDLLEQGADVNLRDSQGRNALVLAVQQDSPALLWRLLRAGADPQQGHHAGRSLLMLAACGKPELTQALLEHGADPNLSRDLRYPDVDYGWTALLYAMKCGNLQSAKLLLEAGANLLFISSNYDFMSSNGSSSGSVWALGLAQDRQQQDVLLKTAIQSQPNVSKQGNALALAALGLGLWESFELLRSRGMPIDGYPDPKGNTLLMQALQREFEIATLQKLLARGANPRHKNKAGQTAQDLLKQVCIPLDPMEYHADAIKQQASWCRQARGLLK